MGTTRYASGTSSGDADIQNAAIPDDNRRKGSAIIRMTNKSSMRPSRGIESTVVAPTGAPAASKDAGLWANDDELWGFKTVIAKTGLLSVYGYVARGIFPRQRRLVLGA
jgi:hypothetical protein